MILSASPSSSSTSPAARRLPETDRFNRRRTRRRPHAVHDDHYAHPSPRIVTAPCLAGLLDRRHRGARHGDIDPRMAKASTACPSGDGERRVAPWSARRRGGRRPSGCRSTSASSRRRPDPCPARDPSRSSARCSRRARPAGARGRGDLGERDRADLPREDGGRRARTSSPVRDASGEHLQLTWHAQGGRATASSRRTSARSRTPTSACSPPTPTACRS